MKKYRDHYFLRAKQENYPARSVYKLQEINKRFQVLGPGGHVLDLGAAPGSWTLYAAKAVGPGGFVLGVDLQETPQGFPENVVFMQADVFDRPPELEALIAAKGPFDAVVSDMAPRTTGIKFRDQALSEQLCREALALAETCLIKGGHLVVKIFEGPDSKAFAEDMRKVFAAVKYFKPKSSREESKEIFIIGLSKKDGPARPARRSSGSKPAGAAMAAETTTPQ